MSILTAVTEAIFIEVADLTLDNSSVVLKFGVGVTIFTNKDVLIELICEFCSVLRPLILHRLKSKSENKPPALALKVKNDNISCELLP